MEVRCRPIGPRGGSESWWDATKDAVARYGFGAKHCFLAVSCAGASTVISYLGNGVNVVDQGASSLVKNNDTEYSNAGDYKPFSTKGPASSSCSNCNFENCVSNIARQLQASNFRIQNYSVIGPNSNSFAHRLVIQCGGSVVGDPGPTGAYGWYAPWNIHF